MNLENVVLVVGGVLTGLHAGLLYAFTVAFVPSLRAVDAKSHIKVFQVLNVKIEKPESRNLTK